MIQSHVIFGGAYFVLSLVQLSKKLRLGYPVIHRVSGRIAIVCGVLSGLGAFVVSVVMVRRVRREGCDWIPGTLFVLGGIQGLFSMLRLLR